MRTRTRGVSALAVLVAGALAMAGCSSAPNGEKPSGETITVTSLDLSLKEAGNYESGYNSEEVEVKVPLNPQRVVVFDSTMLEALDALGVPATQIAGTGKWNLGKIAPAYNVDSVKNIQSADERGYDLEAIDALNPDLLITGWRGSAAGIEGLDDIDAPRIELTPGKGHTVESLTNSTETLGRIFDREDEAKALVEKLDTAIADAKAATKDAGTGVVIMTTGGAMSGVSATDSRYGMLYNEFGIQVNPELESVIGDLNEKENQGAHGSEFSAEAILAANPDWIFVIDRDAAIGQGEQPAEQILDNELIKQSTAGSKGQIVYLDPVAMYAGEGIVSYTAAGEQIAKEVGATK